MNFVLCISRTAHAEKKKKKGSHKPRRTYDNNNNNYMKNRKCTVHVGLAQARPNNALINVKWDPSPMGRVTGLGGDSINFRIPGKGVFERTRGRFGGCPCTCAVFTRVGTTKP